MSLLFAFEADAVEYGEYKTGKRTEGATYAIYSFFRKVSRPLRGSRGLCPGPRRLHGESAGAA